MIEIRARSPRELQPERKVYSRSQSISRRNVFQERLIQKVVVVGLFLTQFLQYGRSSQGKKRQHCKVSRPCLILSKLQYCVSHEVFSVFRRSILYVKSQTSLRFVNISSSNSSSLVLFISPRYCILVFYPFCLFQSCGTLVRCWFTEEPFNGFQNFQNQP